MILQFSTRDTIPSRLTERLQGGGAAHVDMVLPCDVATYQGRRIASRGDLVGSTFPGGVAIRTLAKDYRHRKRFRLKYAPARAMIRSALVRLGQGYDLPAIAGFLLRQRWGASEFYHCAELVITCAWENYCYPLRRTGRPELITPWTLLLSPSLEEVADDECGPAIDPIYIP